MIKKNESLNNRERNLLDKFEGIVPIDKAEEHTYLGFVISSTFAKCPDQNMQSSVSLFMT